MKAKVNINFLIQTIEKKASQVAGTVKTGRTHLMDAMPIDMSQELLAWSSQLKTSKDSLLIIMEKLLFMPQGGTAVGTGINAHPRFAKEFAKELSKLSGHKIKSSNNFFHSISLYLDFFNNTLSFLLLKLALST